MKTVPQPPSPRGTGGQGSAWHHQLNSLGEDALEVPRHNIRLKDHAHRPTCCLLPSHGGVVGGTLTVAHALQEVFEGFSQLPRLQDKGQAQGLIGGLGFGEGGGPTHPGPGKGWEEGQSLTCLTWGRPRNLPSAGKEGVN